MPPMATSGTPAASRARGGLRAASASPTTGSGLVLLAVSNTGPNATYVGARGERRIELRAASCVETPTPRRGRDAADAIDGHVGLPDVHHVAPREHRQVGPIVGDEGDARAVAERARGRAAAPSISRGGRSLARSWRAVGREPR